MSLPDNLHAVLERLYTALQTGDLETWASMHADDVAFNIVAFNINGGAIMSARITGKEAVMSELHPPAAHQGEARGLHFRY